VVLVVNGVPNIAAFERELEPTLCGHKDNPWPERSQRILDLIESDTQMTAPWIEVCTQLVTYFQTSGKVYGFMKGWLIPTIVFCLFLPPFMVGAVLDEIAIGGSIASVLFVLSLILFMRLAWQKRKSTLAMASITAEHARLLGHQNTGNGLFWGPAAGVMRF
jgi:hypothetical protein